MRMHPILLSLVLLFSLASLCNSTGQAFGNYSIPVDKLSEEYCSVVPAFDMFDEIDRMHEAYSSFLNDKITDLREPTLEFIKNGQFVRLLY